MTIARNLLIGGFALPLLFSIGTAPASAGPETAAQMEAEVELAAGYTVGYACHLNVHHGVGERLLSDAFGGAALTTAQASRLASQSAITAAMLTGGGQNDLCTDALKKFGPQGSIIPDLISRGDKQ